MRSRKSRRARTTIRELATCHARLRELPFPKGRAPLPPPTRRNYDISCVRVQESHSSITCYPSRSCVVRHHATLPAPERLWRAIRGEDPSHSLLLEPFD